MRAERKEYYGYGYSNVDAFVQALNKALNDIECENLTVDLMLECYVREYKELDNSHELVTLKYSKANHPVYNQCRKCIITRELM